MILFGRDKYEEAMELFGLIINKEESKEISETMNTLSLFPSSSLSSSSSSSVDDSLHHPYASIIELEGTNILIHIYFINYYYRHQTKETLLPVAVNNYSICALYLRKGVIIIILKPNHRHIIIITLSSLL